MGYAVPTQITHGIHFRQWARAFIIADAEKKSRVVFVNADICMGTQIMKTLVSDLGNYNTYEFVVQLSHMTFNISRFCYDTQCANNALHFSICINFSLVP